MKCQVLTKTNWCKLVRLFSGEFESPEPWTSTKCFEGDLLLLEVPILYMSDCELHLYVNPNQFCTWKEQTPPEYCHHGADSWRSRPETTWARWNHRVVWGLVVQLSSSKLWINIYKLCGSFFSITISSLKLLNIIKQYIPCISTWCFFSVILIKHREPPPRAGSLPLGIERCDDCHRRGVQGIGHQPSSSTKI